MPDFKAFYRLCHIFRIPLEVYQVLIYYCIKLNRNNIITFTKKKYNNEKRHTTYWAWKRPC